MIQLSKRLQAVAELAKTASIRCVADIGTDHGYIPIWLVEQGIAERAIAMDIRIGPLQRAQKHIREQGLEAYIETRLSDGLAALRREEAQVIVIAGMGGATMSGILEAGRSVISPDTILVLQPQSELYEFRRYLAEHDFVLLAEDMVEEDGKYYPMMKVQMRGAAEKTANQEKIVNPGKTANPEKTANSENDVSGSRHVVRQDGSVCEKSFPYTELELHYGPLLLIQRHPVLKEFLLWQLAQKERILEQLSEQLSEQMKSFGEGKAVLPEEKKREEISLEEKKREETLPAEKKREETLPERKDRRTERKQEILEEIARIRQALGEESFV